MLYQSHKQEMDRSTSEFWEEARKNARAKGGEGLLVSAVGFNNEAVTYSLPTVPQKEVVFITENRNAALDVSDSNPESSVIYGSLKDVREEYQKKFGFISLQFDHDSIDSVLSEFTSTVCLSGKDVCIFHLSLNAELFGDRHNGILEKVVNAQAAATSGDEDTFIANYMPVLSPIKIPWSNACLDHKVSEFKKVLKPDDIKRIISMFPKTKPIPIAKAFTAAGVISKHLFLNNRPGMIFGTYHEVCDNKCRIHVFGQVKKFIINKKPERKKAELFTTGGYSVPLFNDFE